MKINPKGLQYVEPYYNHDPQELTKKTNLWVLEFGPEMCNALVESRHGGDSWGAAVRQLWVPIENLQRW